MLELADIGTVALDVFDEATFPPPVTCSCGRVLDWLWRDDLPVTARWVRPKHNPCHACESVGKAKQVAEDLAHRQRVAGVPAKLRGYRLNEHEVQGRDEGDEDFQARVARCDPPRIGVTRASTAAWIGLGKWRPSHGSAYVHGPVGTGKSLMCAAIVTDLVDAGEMVKDRLTEAELRKAYGTNWTRARELKLDTVYRQRKTYDVLLIDEAELMRRQELAWKLDQAPLAQVTRQSVLVLDDLGIRMRPNGTVPDVVSEAIERLVYYRNKERLPMLITSNLTWDEMASAYGDRTADRLGEMCGPRVWALGGASWRQVERRPAQRARRAG